MPPQLSSFQRARLHELGEKLSLEHTSSDCPSSSDSAGEPAQRRMTFGVPGGEEVALHSDGPVSDEQLARWLATHLSVSFPACASRAAPRSAVFKPPASVGEFVERTRPLLDDEHAAEVAQAEAELAGGACARGGGLTKLRVTDASPGFSGRVVVTLCPARGDGAVLGEHKLGTHDVVAIRPSKGDASLPPLAKGLVTKVTDCSVCVALDDAPEDELDGILRVERLANDVTHTRLKATLSQLQTASTAGSSSLVDVLFGTRPPRAAASPALPPPQRLNASLDESQADAVSFALSASDIALIHGPPGTGKTTALVELVLQCVARGERVLVAAASNVAVDNLVERLRCASPKLGIVRTGHPSRLSPAVLGCCVEALVAKSDASALAADCRAEMSALTARLAKMGRHQRTERKEARRQLGALGREARQRSSAAVDEVLSSACVVAATLSGCGARALRAAAARPGGAFATVVIDEAAQATEAACWAALLLGRKAGARRCVIDGHTTPSV